MQRNSFILLGLGVVLVLSVALSASAAPILDKPRTFSLLEVNRSEVALGDFTRGSPPVGGAQVLRSSDAYSWSGGNGRGQRVGRTRVLLTFMSGFGESFAHSAIVLVTGQVTLSDGTLLVEGYAAIPPGRPAKMTLPVVGGTGIYANARGELTVRDGGRAGTRLDFDVVP